MTNLKTVLLATAALLALAGPAAAQPNKMAILCAMNFCAYDENGHILGVSPQQGIASRQIGDTVYLIGYSSAGLDVDLQTYYLSADCTGQAFMVSGYIGADGVTPVPSPPPAFADWDGTSFWAPVGATAVLSPRSTVCHGEVCGGNPASTCLPTSTIIAPYYPAFAPAAKIQTPTISDTPACAAAQSCVSIH